MENETVEQNRYRELLDLWDIQQAAYIAGREARFDAVLDTLAMTCPPDMLVVGLACGPGSFSERIAQRFPAARLVSIDLDTVFLALCQLCQPAAKQQRSRPAKEELLRTGSNSLPPHQLRETGSKRYAKLKKEFISGC